MKNCEKCGEELNKDWDVCWKCSHIHKKETTIPKESLIKKEIELNEKETNTSNVFEEKLLSEVEIIKSILQFFLVISIISLLSSLLMWMQF